MLDNLCQAIAKAIVPPPAKDELQAGLLSPSGHVTTEPVMPPDWAESVQWVDMPGFSDLPKPEPFSF